MPVQGHGRNHVWPQFSDQVTPSRAKQVAHGFGNWLAIPPFHPQYGFLEAALIRRQRDRGIKLQVQMPTLGTIPQGIFHLAKRGSTLITGNPIEGRNSPLTPVAELRTKATCR